VFTNTTVVTGDTVRDDVALAVAGDRIPAIGPSAKCCGAIRARTSITGAARPLLPGLMHSVSQSSRVRRVEGPALSAAEGQKTTQTKMGGGGSPHVKSEWTIDGANITIEYGRLFLKGRKEAEMMPAGKQWRTGADEATPLVVRKALKFGSLSVPPGSYTLYTVPGASEWQLVISKNPGTHRYSLELGINL
jgi:hypothetical protein